MDELGSETTHVVFQGKHYELPGTLSREEAFLRVQNLTGDGPRMSPDTGTSRPLSPVEQGDLDTADKERMDRLRGEGWSEGTPDLQDWKKLGEGALFAATPSVPTPSVGALARSTAAGVAGAAGGGYLGHAAGRGLEYAGAPGGTAEVLGKVGGVTGGLVGGIGGPKVAAGMAEAIPSHSASMSLVKWLLNKMAGTAAPKALAAAEGAPAAVAATEAAPSELVAKLMRGETSMGKMTRSQAEALAAKAEGASQMPTQVDSARRAARLKIGAEKVGRGAGMTKEQVRMETGPRLGEARGEASPVFPDDPFNTMADRLLALPPDQRSAYVMAAKSQKTQAQLETMRRMYQKLGLSIPFWVTAGLAGNAMSGESH